MKRITYYTRRAAVELKKVSALIRKDKYDRMAAELEQVMLENWNITSDQIRDVIASIRGGTPFTQTILGQTISGIRPVYSDLFTRQVAGPTLAIQAGVFADAIADTTGRAAFFSLEDEAAIEMLHEQNMFWIGNYYDETISAEIAELGTQAIREGLSLAEAGELFAANFDSIENKGAIYWEGLASHVVTRAQSIGRISGMEKAGIEYAEIRAVIDHRTTDVCRHMHRKVIPLRRLQEARDTILDATDDPQKVRDSAPWMNKTAWQGKTVEELNTSSLLPPYHFRCRSTYTTATETQGIEQQEYDDLWKQTRNDADIQELFREFYNDGWEEQAINARLMQEEEFLIWSMTRGYQDKLNAAIRSGSLSSNQQAAARLIDDALRKIPRKDTSFYHFPKRNLTFNTGEELSWDFFTSGSAQNSDEYKLRVKIEGPVHDITGLSFNPEETGFMLRPGSSFRVKSVSSSGGFTDVVLTITGKDESIISKSRARVLYARLRNMLQQITAQ